MNILIELLLYAINVFIILKSMGKTKALGIALLLSRLTFLLFLLPTFFQWINLLYIFYFIGILAVISLLLFFIKRSLVLRNYAILVGAFLLFGKMVVWIGFAFLLLSFYNDKRSPKKLEIENKKVDKG